MAEHEHSGQDKSDAEVFERFIESLGGREAALEKFDTILFVKQLKEAMSIAWADLIMGHPEFDWDAQIALNTPEGKLQIERFKRAMSQSLRRAWDMVRSPTHPDA